MSIIARGVAVTLNVPGNPRLDGAAGVIESVEGWGCHVLTRAAATGVFRAAWGEMAFPAAATAFRPAGDVCDLCGGSRMQRAGACLVCLECGQSSGCG